MDELFRLDDGEVVQQTAGAVHRLGPHSGPCGFQILGLNVGYELLQRAGESLFV